MHIKYMKRAIELAKIAYKNGDVPVGSVIVNKEGFIIGEGYNLKELNNNPLEHAEIVAISNSTKKIGQWRLNNCIIYTTLEPCLMCVGAILHARIFKVYFALPDFKFGAVISKLNLLDKNNFNHQAKYNYGILEADVKIMMQEFFLEIRKKNDNKNKSNT